MSLFDKLDVMEKRFLELDQRSQQPDFFTNPERARAMLKEHAGLKRNVDRFREYKKAVALRDETKALVSDAGGDDELRQMAKAELPELEKNVQDTLDKVREMLVSEDEDSNKNVIVDIQAGVGGDEAALFA